MLDWGKVRVVAWRVITTLWLSLLTFRQILGIPGDIDDAKTWQVWLKQSGLWGLLMDPKPWLFIVSLVLALWAWDVPQRLWRKLEQQFHKERRGHSGPELTNAPDVYLRFQPDDSEWHVRSNEHSANQVMIDQVHAPNWVMKTKPIDMLEVREWVSVETRYLRKTDGIEFWQGQALKTFLRDACSKSDALRLTIRYRMECTPKLRQTK